jgi:hypothetical protein
MQSAVNACRPIDGAHGLLVVPIGCQQGNPNRAVRSEDIVPEEESLTAVIGVTLEIASGSHGSNRVIG